MLYAVESERIAAALPAQLKAQLEHFGSTAVPGLPAKPVIDILIAVASLAAARDLLPDLLLPLGYAFWRANPRSDRLFFVRGLPPEGARRTHHLHVCERPSALWDQLAFRDLLRARSDLAALYADAKYELARRHRHDREAYTAAKGEVIAAIIRSAGRGRYRKVRTSRRPSLFATARFMPSLV